MARHFTRASTEYLTVASGAVAALTDYTVAAIVRKASDDASHYYPLVGGANDEFILYLYTDNKVGFYVNSVGVDTFSAFTVTASEGWVFVAVSHAAGTTTPVFHKYVYTTNTWTHSNGSPNQGNISSIGAGGIYIGTHQFGFGGGHCLDGDLAALGILPANLANQQVEALAYSLSGWFQAQLKALWTFDQDKTTQKVVDLSGGGANEATITGTSIASTSVPVFNYGDGTWTPTIAKLAGGGATQQEASGTAAITTAATGAANVTVLPSGAAAVTTGASGAGTVTVGASGTAAAAVAATGAATVTVRPSGAAAIATAATGAGTAKTETAGTSAVATSAAGAATVKIGAVGSSAVTIGATGTATVPGAVQATGTAAITVTAAGAGTVRTNTTGAAALVTASTGTATAAAQTSGAAAVTSSATGSAKVSLVGAGTATVTFLAAGSPTTPAGTGGTASIVVQAFGAAQAGVTAPAGHIEPGDGLSGVLEGGGAAPVDWTLLTAGTVLGSGSRLGADIMSGPEPAGGLVGVVE